MHVYWSMLILLIQILNKNLLQYAFVFHYLLKKIFFILLIQMAVLTVLTFIRYKQKKNKKLSSQICFVVWNWWACRCRLFDGAMAKMANSWIIRWYFDGNQMSQVEKFNNFKPCCFPLFRANKPFPFNWLILSLTALLSKIQSTLDNLYQTKYRLNQI